MTDQAQVLGHLSPSHVVQTVQALVIAQIPSTPVGAHQSYCGPKDFLIQASVLFPEDRTPTLCARAAVVWFGPNGSPYHEHNNLVEFYVGLEGDGEMVFGQQGDERIVAFGPGSIALIEPRTPHGLAALPDTSMKVLLIFNPFIAPLGNRHRDEVPVRSGILTRDLLEELRGSAKPNKP